MTIEKCKIVIFVILYLLLPEFLNAQKSNLSFRHLTTDDGLSQSNITAIIQDRQGFMWFATREGLNRYDGNTFIVYKNNPNDSASISGNFILDLMEDDQGYLWIATTPGGISKFDPTTGRFTNYLHNPDNRNSPSDNSVVSIARDDRGFLWFGTGGYGLDKFDPVTETFTHYYNDRDGKSLGSINSIVVDSHGEIWFAGDRGLFRLNPQTDQITHLFVTKNIAADYICEDKTGNLWLLAWTPVVGLIKYDRQTERLTEYSIGDGAVGIARSQILDDGKNGFWVASSLGLYHFDRNAEQFTHYFQHDETNLNSLNNNRVVSIYQDRSGLLWVGTEDEGINILDFQQEQFGLYKHDPTNSNSLSSGKVTAIHQDRDNILWVGLSPRALDRFDRKTGQITHYFPDQNKENKHSQGYDINSICKDTQGFVWLSGWNSGLDRFDERSGQFKHYRHNPDDPHSLISNDVLYVFEDRSNRLWVGQNLGLSRFDRVTDQFTNYCNNPANPTSLGGNAVRIIYQDRSGVLWLGTWNGVLSCFDTKTNTFKNYTPDSRDPRRLNGGAIVSIHEDQAGTLWLGAADGLYRFDRGKNTFTRYTENQGLPSSSIVGVLEDWAGMLWISTRKGLSRFNPKTESFRNYDIADGLQSNDFSESCYEQGQNGEMFFGGNKGFNAFFPENIKDNPYVPPIVVTDFRLFGKSVSVGNGSVLYKAINATDSLILPHNLNSFSFEFAALSYAAPEKNQYRYKLEGFDSYWHHVGSNERLAVYTNLHPDNYIFRVQGSNENGMWNEEGRAIYISILPPWWQTWWFRSLVILLVLSMIYSGFLLRVRNIKKHNLRLESEVSERTRQLQVANNELEAFSYSVSHDLRAPLRSIDGFSQILLNEYQDMVDEQRRNYLHRVRSATQRMAQLIDDMLTLSKVSRSEINIRQVNLSKMVQDITGELRENQPEREVEFIIQQGIKVQGDSHLLRIVLENLIGNAWKFTSKHPTARIEFGMQLQNELPVYFIRDNGAGFNMEYAQKLFGAFQRLHANTEFPGTGIGLATVQRVIQRHGGKVWAEGEVEKGATFYFTLA